MLQVVFSSFLLVALSEMGDKTQLLAFSLAARFKKPRPILAGIFVATVFNHLLASAFGQWIATEVNRRTLAIVLAMTFIAFGLWTLKPDTFEESDSKRGWGPFATTAVLFFLAEMGDKTQLATVALAAKYGSAVLVTVGTTLGMMFTDGLAVLLGDRLAQRGHMKWIRWAAASLFFVFGISTLLGAIFR
jgi:putative Ca2+/H+ antiporter (TMEM165/GDT1 family)